MTLFQNYASYGFQHAGDASQAGFELSPAQIGLLGAVVVDMQGSYLPAERVEKGPFVAYEAATGCGLHQQPGSHPACAAAGHRRAAARGCREGTLLARANLY